MKFPPILLLFIFFHVAAIARTSYTGYSGAPGSRGVCASSCHGSSGGTMTVTGIPASYIPGTVYTITVKRNGGSKISNFNASTRVGTTTTVAGSFGSVSGATTYSVSGVETGVRSSSNNIDSAKFSWTAPVVGTGQVKFFIAGMQGSSASGPNTLLTFTLAEGSVNTINQADAIASGLSLYQNYPNPFNPSTIIKYETPVRGWVSLKIFDLNGNEVSTLVNRVEEPGEKSVLFNASALSSGVYFCQLKCNGFSETRRLLLLR